MDWFLGALGVIAFAIGGISLVSGVNGNDSEQIYAGFALIGSGIGLLSFASIINLLKEIRDGILASSQLPAPSNEANDDSAK